MHLPRLLLWIALCAVEPCLPGQEVSLVRSSADTLCSKLASSDPRRVAHAAAEVAANVRKELQPQALAALKTWSARNSDDAAVVRLFLLDALLQTGAQVPAKLLRPHLQGMTEVPAFVLLARFPKQNQGELLAVFRARADARSELLWVAAGSLLCELRTPGFAALLLRSGEWTLHIDVVDRPCGRCGGCVNFQGGGTQLSARAGFPPVPAWSLEPTKPPMQALARSVRDGSWDISSHRELITTSGTSGPGFTNWGDHLPEVWLEEMAGGVPAAKICFATICYTNDAEFVATLERYRLDTLADRRRLLRALVAKGALTRDEMNASQRPLQLVVQDEREAPASPLPGIQGTIVRQ